MLVTLHIIFPLFVFVGFAPTSCPILEEKARRFTQARTGWTGLGAGAWGRSMI